ncbi:MAG: OmpH family outer membrane protein [bacterium]
MADEKKVEQSEMDARPGVEPPAVKAEEPPKREAETDHRISELNAEAASWRTQLRAKEKELADAKAEADKTRQLLADERKRAEREKMTEQERLQAELEERKQADTEAQKRLKDLAMQNAVLEEAADMNFRSPKDAARLVDHVSIGFDEYNRPNRDQINSALKQLAEEKDYLIRKDEPPPRQTPPAAHLATGNNPPLRPSGPGAQLKIVPSEEAVNAMKAASAGWEKGAVTANSIKNWVKNWEKLPKHIRQDPYRDTPEADAQ